MKVLVCKCMDVQRLFGSGVAILVEGRDATAAARGEPWSMKSRHFKDRSDGGEKSFGFSGYFRLEVRRALHLPSVFLGSPRAYFPRISVTSVIVLDCLSGTRVQQCLVRSILIRDPTVRGIRVARRFISFCPVVCSWLSGRLSRRYGRVFQFAGTGCTRGYVGRLVPCWQVRFPRATRRTWII